MENVKKELNIERFQNFGYVSCSNVRRGEVNSVGRGYSARGKSGSVKVWRFELNMKKQHASNKLCTIKR